MEPTVSVRVGALRHTRISRVPFPSYRSGVIGLAIAGNPENDGHLSPWQEAAGHEIIPDTHRNGCANEATTGLHARALCDSVSGRRVRLAGTRGSLLEPTGAKR
jgi:hypothetical protein